MVRTFLMLIGWFAPSYWHILVIFSWFSLQKASDEFLLEGDLFVPKIRNAMKCLNDAFNCLWPKSSDGKVWVPYILSEKYGRWCYNGRGLSFTCFVTDQPLPLLQMRARKTPLWRPWMSSTPKHASASSPKSKKGCTWASSRDRGKRAKLVPAWRRPLVDHPRPSLFPSSAVSRPWAALAKSRWCLCRGTAASNMASSSTRCCTLWDSTTNTPAATGITTSISSGTTSSIVRLSSSGSSCDLSDRLQVISHSFLFRLCFKLQQEGYQ